MAYEYPVEMRAVYHMAREGERILEKYCTGLGQCRGHALPKPLTREDVILSEAKNLLFSLRQIQQTLR